MQNLRLLKLYEMQKSLDKYVLRTKGLLNEDRTSEKILALIVEVSELLNELPEVFKFWSNKKNQKDKAIVEYIDGLHFLLSIGNDKGFQVDKIGAFTSDDLPFQFQTLYTSIDMFKENMSIHNYEMMMRIYLGLGEMLDFTASQIISTYNEKNAHNFKRQESGY